MKDKSNREFYRKLLKLVVPISLQQLMMALVSVTDAVMLGFLNQDSLSAVSLAGQIQFVFGLFVFAITGGVSIFAAQYWGKGNIEAVEKILGIGLKVSMLISLPFTLGAMFVPQLMMRAFASNQILIDYGAEYLRIVGITYFLQSISQICLCIMKNCGQELKCSLISSVSVVINIIFNLLLIFGIGPFPKLGISGAAVATVISKVVEVIWALAIMAKKGSVKIHPKFMIHTDPELHKDYWKYTMPLVGGMLGWGVGFTMYTVIMGHMGTDATAANSIANIIKNLTVCFSTGIASASGVMIGRELGKGNLDTAKEYGSKLCKTALLSGIISGCIILCILPFVPLFSSLSLTAQKYLRVMLIVCSYYVIGKAMNMTTISGIFPAGGDSKFGFKCDTTTMWAVTVPIGLIAAFVLKLPVIPVYIMINIDEIIKLPAVYHHYKKYLWVKNLTKQ